MTNILRQGGVNLGLWWLNKQSPLLAGISDYGIEYLMNVLEANETIRFSRLTFVRKLLKDRVDDQIPHYIGNGLVQRVVGVDAFVAKVVNLCEMKFTIRELSVVKIKTYQIGFKVRFGS